MTIPKMSRLKPPKNLRKKRPRVCATCAHVKDSDTIHYCARPNGPHWTEYMDTWFVTCDRWAT